MPTLRGLRVFAASVLLSVVLTAMLGAPVAAGAEGLPQPSSTELVTHPSAWDGRTIAFEGEALVGAMRRGGHAWIHVNDDGYQGASIEEGAHLRGKNRGQAVWLAAELVEPVRFWGDYAHQGDVVRVTGVFNAACAEHGGDMDIHAVALGVTHPGHRVVERVHPYKWALAALLAIGALVLAWAQRRTARLDLFGALATRRKKARAGQGIL